MATAEADDGGDPLRCFVQHAEFPEDAQRVGLDPNTQEGAMLNFAASLDAAKPMHRICALVVLAFVAWPVLTLLVRLL